MDLTKFQQINAIRGAKWHKNGLDDWSLLEWAGAMCGESGEAANVAKKIRRIQTNLPNRETGIRVTEIEILEDKLCREVADSIIYGLLIMSLIGKNASEIITEVFNQKSIEYGFEERAPK